MTENFILNLSSLLYSCCHKIRKIHINAQITYISTTFQCFKQTGIKEKLYQWGNVIKLLLKKLYNKSFGRMFSVYNHILQTTLKNIIQSNCVNFCPLRARVVLHFLSRSVSQECLSITINILTLPLQYIQGVPKKLV